MIKSIDWNKSLKLTNQTSVTSYRIGIIQSYRGNPNIMLVELINTKSGHSRLLKYHLSGRKTKDTAPYFPNIRNEILEEASSLAMKENGELIKHSALVADVEQIKTIIEGWASSITRYKPPMTSIEIKRRLINGESPLSLTIEKWERHCDPRNWEILTAVSDKVYLSSTTCPLCIVRRGGNCNSCILRGEGVCGPNTKSGLYSIVRRALSRKNRGAFTYNTRKVIAILKSLTVRTSVFEEEE